MTLNLVTGADGFVGQHLVTELLRRGEEVVGAVLKMPPQLTTLTGSEAGRVRWLTMDLERVDTIRELTRQTDADRVFHLAGLSSPAASFDDPVAPLKINAMGTLLLLEELAEIRRGAGRDRLILISGSAHVYGAAAARHRPLTEGCPLEPLNPYAVSKAVQELLGLQYYRSRGLSVIVTRSFNHTGPGQSLPSSRRSSPPRSEKSSEGGSGPLRWARQRCGATSRTYGTWSGLHRVDGKRRAGTVYNVCSGCSYAVSEIWICWRNWRVSCDGGI